MTDLDLGWKFGADIKQGDGHFAPSTCYVAVKDHDAAKEALLAAHPDCAFHSGRGERVTRGDWQRAFDAEPNADEIRIT